MFYIGTGVRIANRLHRAFRWRRDEYLTCRPRRSVAQQLRVVGDADGEVGKARRQDPGETDPLPLAEQQPDQFQGCLNLGFVTTEQWRVEMDVADAHECPTEHLWRCRDLQVPVGLLPGDHLGGDTCGG